MASSVSVSTTATTKSSASTSAIMKEPSPEVPIFLRKTYHMVSSCDPEIACWSDDGETFVVKDPIVFERTIIPQFFKHSKFTSFVRQLNFYSFRKIKNADTIRIDPELEAATANYWRFRHEYFRKDRPDLLTKIKRMNGPKSSTGVNGSGSSLLNTVNSGALSQAVTPASKKNSNDSSIVTIVNKHLPSHPDVVGSSHTTVDVQTLKQRIEEMSKNINELTAMVNKVSLKQEEHEKILDPQPALGTKRLKFVHDFGDDIDDDLVAMMRQNETARPDEMLSCMDIDDSTILLAPIPPDPVLSLSIPQMGMASRASSNETDSEFVDQLFTSFQDDFDSGDDFLKSDNFCPSPPRIEEKPYVEKDEHKRPNPELMRRLGDALMLLPRDIQEMIVDKLIAAITRTEFVTAPLQSEVKKMAHMGKSVPTDLSSSTTAMQETTVVEDMPLAAATLAALLHHYNNHMQKSGHKNVEKSIPVIPVHA